ncbi:unnamed protein product [Symbiodinium sp. CCMP2456]|nr:unnamed protein product [Symbiodinium sp. CCMP2456]
MTTVQDDGLELSLHSAELGEPSEPEGDLRKLLTLNPIDQHRSFGRRLAIVAGVAEGHRVQVVFQESDERCRAVDLKVLSEKLPRTRALAMSKQDFSLTCSVACEEDRESSKASGPPVFQADRLLSLGARSRKAEIRLQCKDVRHDVFASFIAAELLQSVEGSASLGYILEVAGGKGALAFALHSHGIADVVVVDPRQTSESLPTVEMSDLHPEGEEDVHSEPAVRHVRAHFDDSSRDLVGKARAVVAMHPDEATDAVVELALLARCPFAVVPCCVFPTLFSDRRLIDGSGVAGRSTGCAPRGDTQDFCASYGKRTAMLIRRIGKEEDLLPGSEDMATPVVCSAVESLTLAEAFSMQAEVNFAHIGFLVLWRCCFLLLQLPAIKLFGSLKITAFMGLRIELAPRSFDDLERAEAKRLTLTLVPTSGKKLHLVLHQDASVGIAGVMYDCAALLARRLCEEPSLLGSKVVELGCGTGCAGLTAAALGAKVVLTDRSERALRVVQQSAKETGLEVRTSRWEWHEQLPAECRGASTVLATDVVYSEDTSALLSALKAVTVAGTVVLLVVRVRSLAALAGLRSLLQDASRVFKAVESLRVGVAMRCGSKVESHAAVLHAVVILPCSEPRGFPFCFRSAPRHILNQQHALACKCVERLLHRICQGIAMESTLKVLCPALPSTALISPPKQ